MRAQADPVAQRYAQAFYEAARDAGETEALVRAWDGIAEALSASADLGRALRNPAVPPEAKAAVLRRLASAAWPAGIDAGVRMMLEAGRVEAMGAMAAALRAIDDDACGLMRVRVRSANPLAAPVLDRVRSLVQKRETRRVEIETEVDPALIGGLQIILDYRVLDASVRRQLRDLHDKLSDARVHAKR